MMVVCERQPVHRRNSSVPAKPVQGRAEAVRGIALWLAPLDQRIPPSTVMRHGHDDTTSLLSTCLRGVGAFLWTV